MIVINRGRLVTSGPLSELLETATLVRVAAPERLRSALEEAGGIVELHDGDGLVVRGLRMDRIGELAFAAGLPIRELSPHSESLEDLFFDWTSTDVAESAG